MKNEKNIIHKAVVEYSEELTKYTYEEFDVFHYSDDKLASKMVDNEFHDIEEWLAHTYHIDFPMMPDQIVRYFKNPRSCDIMVSSVAEVCYNYEHGETKNDQVYSHDVGLLKSMCTPLIMGGGSGILTPNEVEYCKSTDIVPTILALLGKTPHKSVVGRNILNN